MSDKTFEKMVEAGWTSPNPDAQEIADELPDGACVVKYGSGWSAFIWPGSMQREKGEIGDTISEALAALWLKTREASK